MSKGQFIFIDKNFETQKQVFEFLAKTAVEKGIANNMKGVWQALDKRESEGTTGMMDGFAIPHAKSEFIQHAATIVIRLNQGIEWNSMDGQSIRYIFALFIPDSEKGAIHLAYLSKIARMLMQEDFKAAFAKVESEEAIAKLLADQMGEYNK